MLVTLSILQSDLDRVYSHLFPGDGFEAVALLLCGTSTSATETRLLVREVIPIEHGTCVRSSVRVTWPTTALESSLRRAQHIVGATVVKMHSHPNGYRAFSDADDTSDGEYFDIADSWFEPRRITASAVLLPDKTILARTRIDAELRSFAIIKVVGDDLGFQYSEQDELPLPDAYSSHRQAFGDGTIRQMRRLKVGVVGCSGTGSLVVEQLARLGVGQLVLVDPDGVEERNLNRIVNATSDDARLNTPKVQVLKRAVEQMGFGTTVTTYAEDLLQADARDALKNCDVLFGCVDSVDGRHYLNKICRYYLIPYFDVGVGLIPDGKGGIFKICGTSHYVQPNGASLLDRKAYSQEQLNAALLHRSNPQEYADRLAQGYIAGIHVTRPAVISVNMLVASLAVNDFLARLHGFRSDGNNGCDATSFSLTDNLFEVKQFEVATANSGYGKGDVVPMLDIV